MSTAEQDFVAAYWPVRSEPVNASAARVLALLADFPDGPPWQLADVAGSEQILAMEPAPLADQLVRDSEAQGIGAGILSCAVREGVAHVKFALGHGQYGADDSVVVTLSQPFDPVEVITSLVHHFDPAWAVCGSHRLRSAQRPAGASAPWLGVTTYLRGPRPVPAGAESIELGGGKVFDFTHRGLTRPDDSSVLAASVEGLAR